MPKAIDYRQVIKFYIQHVCDCEGTTFIGEFCFNKHDPKEYIEELLRLKEEMFNE